MYVVIIWDHFLCPLLGRFEDRDEGVRERMVEAAVAIIAQGGPDPSTHAILEEKLLARGTDPSFKIRRWFVEQICDLAMQLSSQTRAEDFVKIASKLLRAVGDRVLDKILQIRIQSITGLATIFKTFVSSQWSGDGDCEKPLLSEALAWIPSKILTAFGFPEFEIQHRSLLLLDEHMLPRSFDASERARGIINIWKGLGRCSRVAFERLQRARAKVQNIIQAYLDDRENEVNLRRLKAVVKAKPGTARGSMTKAFEDHVHASKDKQVFKLLGMMADPCTPSKVLRKCKKELQRRVGFKHPKTGAKTPQALFISQVAQFCGMLTFDVDTIAELLEIANNNDVDASDAQAAADVLVIAAENFPSTFADHVQSVLSLTTATADELRVPASRIFYHAALFFSHASFKHRTAELLDTCMADIPAVTKNVVRGLFASHLDHAGGEVVSDSIHEIVSTNSLSTQNRNLAAVLSAIAAAAKAAPVQIFLVWEEVHEFIVRNIFLSAETPTLNKDPEVTVYALKALVGMITVFCNSMDLPVHKPEDDERILACTTLLCTLCSKKVREIGTAVKITAFNCLLKMGLFVSYSAKQQCDIAFALTDSNKSFRANALTKLTKRMKFVPGQSPLPNNYLSVFMLFAGDAQLSVSAATKLRSLFCQRRKMYRDWVNRRNVGAGENKIAGPYLVEIALAHAIHLLAHHPEVEGKDLNHLHKSKQDAQQHRKLKTFLQEKLMFLLKPMIRSSKNPDATLPWIFGILEAIRQSNDIMEANLTDATLAKTYILSYLAEHFVENKLTQNKGYDSYPVALPGRLYISKTKQQQHGVMQTNNTKSSALKSFLTFSPIMKKKTPSPVIKKARNMWGHS